MESSDDHAKARSLNIRHFEPIGQLYRRPKGKARWFRWMRAQGQILLDDDFEYKIRLSPGALILADPVELLKEVDCDLFEEIEIPVRISGRDYYEQAVSGRFWVDSFLVGMQQKYKEGLKTQAAIVCKVAIPT